MKATSSNSDTLRLLSALKKKSTEEKSKIWKDIADRLSGSSRRRPAVNVGKLDKLCEKGANVVIPGKILGAGILTKNLTVCAMSASESAIKKIEASKGKFVTLRELVDKNVKAKGWRIMS